MYFCWSGDRPRSQNRGLAGPGGDELLQAASGERHSLLLSNGRHTFTNLCSMLRRGRQRTLPASGDSQL
uniref:Uncharacterized protein n=1 Tax=Sus scrofa TaxID=9823 RepID=A0A8D0N0Y8_PIG